MTAPSCPLMKTGDSELFAYIIRCVRDRMSPSDCDAQLLQNSLAMAAPLHQGGTPSMATSVMTFKALIERISYLLGRTQGVPW